MSESQDAIDRDKTIDSELARITTPTKDEVETIITLRLLKFREKLVKDFSLEKTSSESEGGVIVTTRCTEDSY